MRLLSRVSLAAVAVCVSASLTGGIAVAEENPSTDSPGAGETTDSNQVHFDVYQVEPGVVSIELANGEFEVTPTGEAGIVNNSGTVVEVFPESLGEYEIVAPNEIIVAQHGRETPHSISTRGFCPLGHNPNGSCRGSNPRNTIKCVGGIAGGAAIGAAYGGGPGGAVAGGAFGALNCF